MKLARSLPSRSALVAALLAAGCSNLDDLGEDTRCGNRVIEPLTGEDCEVFKGQPTAADGRHCGEPGTPGACRWVCGDLAPGAACPGGFACGQDGLCRASTGEFDTALALPVESGGELLIGDVSGDGRVDLVVREQAGIAVYAGGAVGFQRASLLQTSGARAGEIVLGHFRDVANADLAMVLAGGAVQALGDASGAFQPVAQPIGKVEDGAQTRVTWVPIATPSGRDEILQLQATNTGFDVQVLDRPPPDTAGLAGVMPFMGAVDRVAHGDVDRPGGGAPLADEIVFFAGGGPMMGPPSVYVVSVECPADPKGACRLVRRAQIDAARVGGMPPAFVADRVALGDLDGDGNPDLLFHLAIPPMSPGTKLEAAAAVAYGDGRGGFFDQPGGVGAPGLPTVIRAAGLDCSSCMSGVAGLLGVGDLDGDGKPDLVTEGGVFFLKSLAPSWTVTPGPAPDAGHWDEVALADFNRDGHLDAAVIGGVRGVELLVGAGGGRFNRLAAALPSGNFRNLRVADLDGDLAPDLALGHAGAHPLVLFSDAQGLPRSAAAQPAFNDADGLEILRNGPGLASDLLIAGPLTMTRRGVARLRASGGRLLQSAIRATGTAEHVVLGRFGAADDALDDMLVFTLAAGARDPWLLETTAPLTGDVRAPAKIAPGAGCDLFTQQTNTVFAAADVDGDRRTEVVALELSGKPGAASGVNQFRVAWARVASGTSLECHALTSLEGVFNATGVQLVDADGDGRRDVVVLMRSAPLMGNQVPPADAKQPGFAVYRGKAGADLFNATPDYFQTAPSIRAVTALGGRMVVVELEKPGLGALPKQGSGAFQVTTPLDLGLIAPGVSSILPVDVNGDGLVDLVIGGDAPAVLLQQECGARAHAMGTCKRGGT